ncbi:hypothetical protein Cme02nite_20770 [Catellatospora methionotrophica]|uniref:Uncharacterized protein n=1 Tax=Catellatospora methionotrophica TaxID=121620 RepID=A0A8J3L7J2_9ACTN|nr:hypothetical protein [Catellatospora methionotrophica]GIG13745.1 hypothetical protein Cme02nite_20770 [Catellatospora methionotrophica]
MTAQLDLFTGQQVAPPPPAPPPQVRRAPVPLGPGEVRYRPFGGQRDCDDCWSAQAAAVRTGKPVPIRRHANTIRETSSGKAHLCGPHKVDRQAAEAAR